MANETKTQENEQAIDALQPFVDVTGAPYPTEATLRHRKSLVRQFGKFMGFNTAIMRMVVKGHLNSK